MKKVILWMFYEDGHAERKEFNSPERVASWLEKHSEVKRVSVALN